MFEARNLVLVEMGTVIYDDIEHTRTLHHFVKKIGIRLRAAEGLNAFLVKGGFIDNVDAINPPERKIISPQLE